MVGSKERIDYIIEYISAYEQKIKLANLNSLFDEAKLFELFAQEICKIWYGQDFSNLNTIKKNYPCVDLLSDDGAIYVQVSTQASIFEKIKGTLRALAETDNPELSKISSPVFFVLSNESESSVKDLVGNDQIGRFPFTVEQNLISTSKIIQRSMTDISFQAALYNLLKKDVEGIEDIAARLLNIFDNSRSVGLFNIDTTINGEYEIDRSDLANKIKHDDSQFKLVLGDAGSGKSAICKKTLLEEEKVLFARADGLVNCHSIDNIWDIDLVKALNFLQGKRVIIYIDALEYLASVGKSTKELLQTLLNEISKHTGLFFIASCRSCDVNAFVKLIGLFNFQKFVVDIISDKELDGICEEYPTINEMRKSGDYSDLIRSPFYINEIISKRIDINELSDVNAFRSFIWKECICLTEKAAEMGIPTNEVYKTVEFIVKERSKRFSVGVPEQEIDLKILNLLRSNNVVTDKDNLIRLKYDIYEDICFEQLFDKEFEICRGKYSSFFENLEQMGNGAYRRYQIWVSNKLLARINREKFLYALVFDKELPYEWHRNTLIGLVKSPFCQTFFEEQESKLISNNMIQELVQITNCFAFEAKEVASDEIESICLLRLNAVGNGRMALISLIYESSLYKNDSLSKNSIIKLCHDYSFRSIHSEKIDEYVCSIITSYVDEYMRSIYSVHHSKAEIINILYMPLNIIYMLSNSVQTWIDNFWCGLINSYLEGSENESRISEDILNWTLENITASLVDNKLDSLLNIASTLWTKDSSRNKKKHHLYEYNINDDDSWGIKGPGKNYSHDHRKISNDIFLRGIFNRKYLLALNWAIELINNFVLEYSSKNHNEVKEVLLFCCDDNTEKKYWGSDRMWFTGRTEHMMPSLIGDLVFWAKETAIELLHIYKRNQELFSWFASKIKSQVLKKSTNIIPLTIIEDIGFEFADSLPGYAIILASNLEIVSWDIQWQVQNTDTPAKNILTKQIMMMVGIPNIEKRYPRKKYQFAGLQDYMARCQLQGEKNISEQCISTLEYLYRTVNTSDVQTLLQIEKMDMRQVKMESIDNKMISVTPVLSADVQKYVDSNEAKRIDENNFLDKLKTIFESNDSDNLEAILQEMNHIKALMTTPEGAINYENYYIMFICAALKSKVLSKQQRTELVCDWTDRINNIFTHKKGYTVDLSLSVVLFLQYWCDIDEGTKRRLKDLMLSCFIDHTNNGQINEIRKILLRLLLQHGETARILFNTIISLAEDEYCHTSYNKKMIHKYRHKNYCIPGGNGIPGPDDIIKVLGLQPYNSRREEIIRRFLYNEEPLDLNKKDIYNMDPRYLFDAANTGLYLNDSDFCHYIRKLMPIFIQSVESRESENEMDTSFQRLNVEELFIRELSDEKGNFKTAIDLLFDDSLFSILEIKSAQRYLSIFHHVAALYFDSYEDSNKRVQYRNCLEYVEEKIKNIPDADVRKRLEIILILGSQQTNEDWNKYETHYSSDEKAFLCKLWGKYYLEHEKSVIHAIFQMKISELLPEVLPVICKTVESIITGKKFLDEGDKTILQVIILKSLLYFSDDIRASDEYHNAYEKLLNILIDCGDERAAVILDEYRTH